MAASTFLAQPTYLQTITANGGSALIPMNQGFNSVQAMIQIGSAPTGTTPTLTFQLQYSEDGTNLANVGSATSALNSAGITLLNVSNVTAPYIKLIWTVGGTTPSFTNVTVNLYVS